MSVLWAVYNVLFPVGFLALLPRFLVRMARRGGYARHFAERFARYDEATLAKLREGSWVWIHAVSVGEVFVALRFMEEYRASHPGTRFVFSTTTSTGRRIGEEQVRDPDVLVYFPLDFPLVVKRALAVIKPRLLVLVECELWPNLIRLAKQRGIPVALINGRISEHSYRGYRKLRLFTRPLLAQVDLLCVQSETEKQMLRDLGADERRLHVLNSAKYDITPEGSGDHEATQAVLRAAGIAEDDLVLLGGSTWPGEEGVLLDYFLQARARFPKLRLVLVPRHAERASEVQKEIEARGLALCRRSALPAAAGQPGSVLLVDTTGELRRFYAEATVIFVGKSLTQHGGQNIIEPAQCGKPIVVGPHMENFPVVLRDFLGAQALIQVPDAAGLAGAVEKLLADSATRRAYGERALQLVREKSGAIRRTVALLDSVLS